MEDNDIITYIKNNLNHDFDHDFNFLLKELIHYQGTLGSEQIVKDILNLFKSELGPKGDIKLRETLQKGLEKRVNQYNQAIGLLKDHKLQEAQEIIVKLIDTFPIKKNGDEIVPIYNFQNLLESVICTKLANPIKGEVRQTGEPITGYYFHLSVILFEEKDYEEAAKMLVYALDYNPVFVEGILLRAECLLKQGYANLFLSETKLALKYSYSQNQLAKAYFLLGRYYLELGNKKLSTALFVLTKHYENNPFIDQMLKKASALQGAPVSIEVPTDLTQIFIDNALQFGPSAEIIELLNGSIEEATSKKRYDVARYFLRMAIDLTQDEYYQRQLDNLPK